MDWIFVIEKPSANWTKTILVAGMGSFVFGYANNAIAGTLAQETFIAKFLTGSNANSIVGGIMGAYEYHI